MQEFEFQSSKENTRLTPQVILGPTVYVPPLKSSSSAITVRKAAPKPVMELSQDPITSLMNKKRPGVKQKGFSPKPPMTHHEFWKKNAPSTYKTPNKSRDQTRASTPYLATSVSFYSSRNCTPLKKPFKYSTD